MTKLEELLYTLASVIIRYHDSQPKVLNKLITENNPISLRRKAIILSKEIIQDQDVEFKARLEDLIKKCTKGYSDRSPFLHFILHEISFLKSMQDRKKSFEPSQLEEYKKQIAQLLIDLKLLMITPKSKTHGVTYTKASEDYETIISLSGLKNDGYVGGEFCNSGNLIKEEVLEALNIHINSKVPEECSSDEEIKEIASSLCMEHQNSLVVPEFLEANQRLIQINQQQQKVVDTKSEQLQDTNKKILELQAKIEDQDRQIKELDQKVKEPIRPHPVFNPGFSLAYGLFHSKLNAPQKLTLDISDDSLTNESNKSPSMSNSSVE
ncbi:hypothetical protein EP47_10170 [Legionella norrlandica]|uniref:Uncharacterized protein n=1 Tax=Legionella norrlandica TaxID=1498499 RepID=A0A0A2STS4_9GAMM|nr:hypothetical protein [Legionella norrlandica]KGP64162.1 hypothetical protein EP47_10170 [Legionella norrlandica]